MSKPLLRHLTREDRNWVLAQHKAIYMEQYGFDESFEVLVAKVLDDFLKNHDPMRERGWIIEQDQQPLGSIFCMRIDDKCAQLRLFCLLQDARGKGLGRYMISELIGFARGARYKEIRLWTHRSHEAACALYRTMNWTCIETEAKVSFGKKETIETYSYTL